jgi:2-polyprenyl-3-methyl-5-hydroxy-6-metoxy-1,4-benzoquinol methylase
MTVSRVVTSQERFISLIDRLEETGNSQIKVLDSYKYFKNIFANKLKDFDFMIRDIFFVRDAIEGKEIIDAGCGSGTFSILLSWLGARKVYAVDYSDDACEMTKFMINFADIGNVEVVHSDIGEFNLPGKSVDGIFSIEAISHYRNYETFLDMSSRVLRDDGFLVIRDNNNGASCQIRRKNLKIWDVFENYPGKTTVFGNTKSDTCYLVMRERIIQDEFPDLSLEEIKKYARFTGRE